MLRLIGLTACLLTAGCSPSSMEVPEHLRDVENVHCFYSPSLRTTMALPLNPGSPVPTTLDAPSLRRVHMSDGRAMMVIAPREFTITLREIRCEY